MKLIKIILFIGLLIIMLHQFISCAPASHVRIGVDVNVPGAWEGPYTEPNDSTLIGRPAPESEGSPNDG